MNAGILGGERKYREEFHGEGKIDASGLMNKIVLSGVVLHESRSEIYNDEIACRMLIVRLPQNHSILF